MTIFSCNCGGDPVRDAVTPVLDEMLKSDLKKEDVELALQKAQKKLVLGCEKCWPGVSENVIWVHAYVEAEKDLLEQIKSSEEKVAEISALCFLHKAAGIGVEDSVAVNFYGETLVPKLMEISGEDLRKKKWLTHVLGERDEPFFKLWKNEDGSLTSDPPLDVDPLYGCVFDDWRSNCVYLHIGHPGRATKLADHVGPAGCYLLLKSRESLAKLPSCLVFHLRAFVQTLVTAQLWVLAKHLHLQERSKVAQLKKYESMYNDLLAPLRSLTEAVRRAQEDAHEIATIIHDPLDVLLGRQSSIAELFIQDNLVSCLPSGIEVKIAHQPSQYAPTGDTASGVAAELLLRLIPELGKNKKLVGAHNSSDVLIEMLSNLNEMANRREDPYYDFSRALRYFLDTDTWGKGLKGETSSWEHLLTIARSEGKVRAVAIKILESAKKRFFTLYKPDQANEALSWEVMRAYLSTLKSPGSNRFIEIPRTLDSGSVVLAEGANPLCTHGHVVAFIGRIVAQHLAYNAQIADVELTFGCVKDDNGCVRFTVTSTTDWLPDACDFNIFLNKQIKYLVEGVRSIKEYGDFERPFVDLIPRVPRGVIPEAINEEGTISLRIESLSFSFRANEFCMYSKRGGL